MGLSSILLLLYCSFPSTAAALAPASAAPPGPLDLLERRVAALERQQAVLAADAQAGAQPPANPCRESYPSLRNATYFYRGYDRNVHRDSRTSVETFQNGTVAFYNDSNVRATGLFDMRITANDAARDSWNFVCTFTWDEPHTATCSLTFETPARAEGPAWVTVRFVGVAAVSPGAPCVASVAVVVGTYFYDALTNDAGVYSFYATNVAVGGGRSGLAGAKRGAVDEEKAAERSALIELAKLTQSTGWVKNRNWLTPMSICDWELVGCDAEGYVKILALDFNNLRGPLPEALGNLTRLEDLDLEHNSLVGNLPASLSRLDSLSQLGLGGNHFDGAFPRALCTPLTRIIEGARARGSSQPPCDLSRNNFTCPLPCSAAAVCGAVC